LYKLIYFKIQEDYELKGMWLLVSPNN